jgi:uncharacterized protein
MKCPVCTNVDLLMSERQGVEIDYCPTCRGVWLDHGELDKIIEREQGIMARYQNEPPPPSPPRQAPPPPQPQYVQGHDQHYRPEHHDDKGHHGYGHGQRRKKSFFEELFD